MPRWYRGPRALQVVLADAERRARVVVHGGAAFLDRRARVRVVEPAPLVRAVGEAEQDAHLLIADAEPDGVVARVLVLAGHLQLRRAGHRERRIDRAAERGADVLVVV